MRVSDGRDRSARPSELVLGLGWLEEVALMAQPGGRSDNQGWAPSGLGWLEEANLHDVSAG